MECTVGVMPGLTIDLLLGVDLLARLQLHIPPPPQDLTANDSCDALSEDTQLQQFLTDELAKFVGEPGYTRLVEYRIRLKNPDPIKQRYRPRNLAM